MAHTGFSVDNSPPSSVANSPTEEIGLMLGKAAELEAKARNVSMRQGDFKRAMAFDAATRESEAARHQLRVASF